MYNPKTTNTWYRHACKYRYHTAMNTNNLHHVTHTCTQYLSMPKYNNVYVESM